MTRLIFSLCVLCVFVVQANAHEVVGKNRDRKIVVQVAYEPSNKHVVVTVAYRVEIGWATALLDLKDFLKDEDYERIKRDGATAFADAFVRFYAPVYGKNLTATANGKPLVFECVKKVAGHKDEEGRNLGHLRCDLLYRASFPARFGDKHEFSFRESNYLLEPGLIELSLTTEKPLVVHAKTEPDEALKKKRPADLLPGDEERLRTATLTFTIPAHASQSSDRKRADPKIADSAEDRADDHGELLRLFLSDHAVWILLLLAAAFGAVHALTPGHGKTLVAAYLVGERGTVGHALFLGLVTTVTHTSSVLVLALVIWLFFPSGLSAEAQQHVQTGLGMVMGLLVAAMGFWLLLRRLSGRADHIHIGGGHHHHHHHHHAHNHSHEHDHDHTHADHEHDAHGHVMPRAAEPVSWWGLVLLGMTGGIVPCWDAVWIPMVCVVDNRVWLGPPAVLAFSAGLAAVLVIIGIVVVRAKKLADSRWGEGRLVRSLPIVSAVCVMVLGFWLCYGSLPPRP